MTKCRDCGESYYMPGPLVDPTKCWGCVCEQSYLLYLKAQEQMELFHVAEGETPYEPITSSEPVKCNDCLNQIPQWFAVTEHSQGWCLECLGACCGCGEITPKLNLEAKGGVCINCDIKRVSLEKLAEEWEE